MTEKLSSSKLDFPSASELNTQKQTIKAEHMDYVEEHPEVKELINDFMTQVLTEKPDDVRLFAKEHFGKYEPRKSIEELLLCPLVIVGPSGAGKGTLVKKLFDEYGERLGLCVSHTTRQPREGEVNGKQYHFTDRDTMEKEIENGLFIEHAHVHGNLYGTSVAAVEDVRKVGKICVLEIDVQGVQAIRALDMQVNCCYIAPPSMEILRKRLTDRGSETPESLEKRLKNAEDEVKWCEGTGNVDITVVNDDLEEAFADLVAKLESLYPTVFVVATDKAEEHTE